MNPASIASPWGPALEIVLVLLALCAGAGLSVQAGVNTAMRGYVGRTEYAALVNFAVGLAALLIWLLVMRKPWPALSSAGRAPWWSWTGGLIGVFYVNVVVLLTQRLGVGMTLALAIAGQMSAALLLDHAGLLGLPIRQVTARHMLGAALLVAGVVLIRR